MIKFFSGLYEWLLEPLYSLRGAKPGERFPVTMLMARGSATVDEQTSCSRNPCS